MAQNHSAHETTVSAGRMSSSSSGAGREQWMDTVKGAAIVLVVFGHSIGVLTQWGWDVFGGWSQINVLMGQWRMPVFMLVAGFFVTRSMTKYGKRFWRLRPLNMVWLYVFWTAVYFVAYPVIGAISRGRTAGEMFALIVEKTLLFDSYLWFLLALAIYYAVQGLLGTKPVPWAVALAFLVFLYFVPGMVDEVSWGTNQLGTNWLFFLVGAWWSQNIRSWVAQIKPWQGVMWCVVCLAAILLWMPTRDVPVLQHFGGILPPLTAVPAGLWVLSRLDGKPGMGWARYVGTRSLSVYVLHPIVLQLLIAALSVVVLNPTTSALATPVTWIGVPVLMVIALLICLVIQRLTDRVPYVWGLPAPRTAPKRITGEVVTAQTNANR